MALAVASSGRIVAADALRRTLADHDIQIPAAVALDAVEVVLDSIGTPSAACPDCGAPAATYGTRTPAGRLCGDCSIRVDDAAYDARYGIGAPR